MEMLYDRWRHVAKEFAGAAALVDAASGKRWTFRTLADAAERGTVAEGIVYPETNCAEFVLAVLRAWRLNRVVCPLEPGQSPPILEGPPPSGIVHLKTTSATGGDPRLVVFTAEQLAADPANLVLSMGLSPEWPNLGVVSLAHSYGFSNLVLPLLLHGIPLVLVRAALPEALKRASLLHSGFTLPAVPALWKMWMEADAVPAGTRLAISAGAPLPLALEQAVFKRFGVKIHNFYGSSECGGIAYDATATPREDGLCVGSPIQNVHPSVGDSGCIEVRGPAVGEGYWPTGGDALRSGVFRTSDLGEFRNGALYLNGRLGDLINVAGRKVAPELIEQALSLHPGVKDCLAFGVALDGHRGESIVGCLSVHPGTSGEDLRHFVSAKLQPWQVPREWWFVDSLRVNGRGKLSRTEWRNRYLTERPRR